jgi:hypothetical protein
LAIVTRVWGNTPNDGWLSGSVQISASMWRPDEGSRRVHLLVGGPLARPHFVHGSPTSTSTSPRGEEPGASVPTIPCDSDDTDWSRTIAGYDKSYLSSGRVQLISSSVGAPIAESVEYAIGAVGLRAFAVPVATATVTARTGIKKRANCSVVVEAISPITTGPTT